MDELTGALVVTTLFVSTFAPNVMLELIGVNAKLVGALLIVRKLVDVGETDVVAIEANVLLVLGTLVL